MVRYKLICELYSYLGQYATLWLSAAPPSAAGRASSAVLKSLTSPSQNPPATGHHSAHAIFCA